MLNNVVPTGSRPCTILEMPGCAITPSIPFVIFGGLGGVVFAAVLSHHLFPLCFGGLIVLPFQQYFRELIARSEIALSIPAFLGYGWLRLHLQLQDHFKITDYSEINFKIRSR